MSAAGESGPDGAAADGTAGDPVTAYDRIAAWYADTRRTDVGLEAADTLVDAVAPGARVLDLGCGTGAPLTERLVAAGLRVTALDASAEMVARARARLPGVEVVHARAEDAAFADGAFDGVLAWGLLFHLPADAQRALVGRVARWLAPGGVFVFTAADGAPGAHEGTMDGERFRYVSLGDDGYRRAAAGLAVDGPHADAWGNVRYVARKA